MSQIIMLNREKQNLLSQLNTINSAAPILVVSLRQQWTEWRTYGDVRWSLLLIIAKSAMKSQISVWTHTLFHQILWRSNDMRYAEIWNDDKGFLRKYLRRCWDTRSTRSSEAWLTSLVITYTKSIWKMVMHGDGEKQDFTQYFHASENSQKQWEICTVQHQNVHCSGPISVFLLVL